MGEKGFYLSALGILVISIANCQGQIQCFRTDWKESEPNCGRGMNLIYDEVNKTNGYKFGWCCTKGSEAAKRMRIRANGCQVTKCIPDNQTDPCSTGLEREYVYQGKKITYEEVNRESCKLEGESKAAAAYCCQKGSTETALFTTMFVKLCSDTLRNASNYGISN